MIRTYFKHRKKATGEPPKRFEQLPPVTIQLPLYNERYVVERLIEEVVKIEYPKELLQIQVLDDSTDDTAPFAEALVRALPQHGLPDRIPPPLQPPRLQSRRAAGRARRPPPAKWSRFSTPTSARRPISSRARSTIFADPKVGVVQTRWSYLNRDYNFLTEVEAMLLDGHFILEHGARSRAGLFFNFNGTAGILRRKMIDDAGGWQHDTLTEDSDLSYRAQLKGWRFVYLPGLDCPSELPVEMHGFQVQQSRWAKGLTQVAKKLLPAILKADIPKRVKVEAFLHLTPNISYPLMIVVSALMLPVMIVRFYMGWLADGVPRPAADRGVVLVDFAVLCASRSASCIPKTWKRSILMLPMLMAVGVGLTIINTRAVLEALFGVRDRLRAHAQVRHRRPPDESGSEEVPPPQRLAAVRGDRRSARTSSAMIVFAIQTYNFFSIPFLALFVFGYYWAGFGTLYQEHQGRLQWLKQQKLALARQA